MTMSYFFFNSIIGQCTEHIASHYIVPRHIESTILRLSNSWYPTTSTTPNTYIDYWSQADAVQSLNVVPSICHWYCVTLVCLVLIISRWWGWTNMQLFLILFPCNRLRHMESIKLSFDWYQSDPCILLKPCCISGRKIMSKHLKDLRMYKCILVLCSAVRAPFAGYASESLCLAGVGPSQSVTSLVILA